MKKFRLAEPNDVSFILSLLREFYEQHKAVYRNIPYDEASAQSTVLSVIQNGICLVGQKSCAGAMLDKFPFNHSAIVAHVVFWKVKGHSEMCIFEHLMVVAKQVGATHFSACGQFPELRIGRYYQRLGLSECEKSWISEL